MRPWATQLCLAAILMSGVAFADPVRMAGSGANVGAINLLVAEFRKLDPTARFAPVEAVGSPGAVKAATAGLLHLALTSRPLSDAERSAGAREVEYARTPFVVAVALDSKIRAVSASQLAQLLTSAAATWPDGQRVRPILRPVNDIDTTLLKRMSPGVAAGLDEAIKRPGMIIASTDKEAADLLERTPGAIGPSTLGAILSESRALRAITVDGKEPAVAALEGGAYPYFKRLYVVVGGKELPATAKRFTEFLASPAAKSILRRHGHLVPPFAEG